MAHLSSKMDQLGTDFHATGSVMTPSQLKEYRLKRGECVTCGRKCFIKKLFKMSPITEPGKVLKGRCLVCNPLNSSTTSSNHKNSNNSSTLEESSSSSHLPSRKASQADVARFSQSQRNLSRAVASSKNSNSIGPGALSRNKDQRVSQSARNFSSSSSTTAALKTGRSRGALSTDTTPRRQGVTRAKSQEELPIPSNKNRLLTRSMSMANVSPRRKKLGLTSSNHQSPSSSSQMKRLSSLSRNSSNSNSNSNSQYRHIDSFAEEDDPDDEEGSSSHNNNHHLSPSSSARRREDGNLRGSRGKESASLRNFFRKPQNARGKPDIETSSRQSALSSSRHSQRSHSETMEEIFHSERDGDDDDIQYDTVIPPEHNRRHRRRPSLGSRGSVGEESFTNASETYDEYAPLPKFGVSSEEIRDALERVNARRPGGGDERDSTGNNSTQSSTPPQYDRSQRSLLSRNSSNNTSGRQQLSSRSLRSTSGHNTDEELAKFERNRPAHGVLNRGGAVNLVRMTNLPQGEIQSADSRGSLFSGGSAEAANHDNTTSARHRYYQRSSNRSLDSMSSFADQHGDDEEIDEYNVIARQESMNSLLRGARDASNPSLSHHASVSSGSAGRVLRSSSQHSRGGTSLHLSQHSQGGASLHSRGGSYQGSQQYGSNHSAQYGAEALEPSPDDHPNAIGVPGGMANSNSHASFGTSLGDLSFSQDGDINGDHESEGLERLNMAGTDVVELVSTMRDYPDSEQTQTQSMQDIANLHLAPDDCDALAEAGGMEAIVDAMERFPDSDQLHLCACRALCNISGTPENQMGLVDIGAADVLLNGTMETFADFPELAEQALAALANLSALNDNLEHLIEKEIVPKLVQTMNKHSKDVQVQMKGCSVITNLASHPSPLKSSVMMAGGGGAVVLCMVVHKQDPQLQEKGLQALRNLSANNEENKLELAHIGGIDSCINAMQVHRDDPFVQEAGAWTLCNLAGHFDNKRQIGESGGIDVLIRAMWVHAQQQVVLEWCVRALCAISVHEDNCYPIMEVGGISAVVTAMQAHDKSPLVQEMGCAALCNLAVDEAAKKRIVEEEALDAIVLAMVLFTEDDKVQERACQALLELAIPEHLTQMQASNVSELAHSAAMKFPDVCQVLAEDLEHLLAQFTADYRM